MTFTDDIAGRKYMVTANIYITLPFSNMWNKYNIQNNQGSMMEYYYYFAHRQIAQIVNS